MSENLLAVIATDYSQSVTSTLTGGRGAANDIDASPAVARVATQLKGDLALFAYGDPNNLTRLMVRAYAYSTISQDTYMYNPQQRNAQGDLVNWTPIANANWPGTPNTHGVFSASSGAHTDSRQRMLIATGYDLGRIIVVDMGGSYAQKLSLLFPKDINPQITNNPKLPEEPEWHGEDVWVQNIIDSTTGNLTATYVYLLFNYNPGGGYENYDQSVVMKFLLTVAGLSVPTLTYVDYVRVGKNSTSFVPFEDKLFIAAIGGMQNDGTYNKDTGIWYVDVSSPSNSMNVFQVKVPTISPQGDFRDVCIRNPNEVYILVGYFNKQYTEFVGSVYLTTLANFTNQSTTPSAWTLVISISSGTVSESGDYWSLFNDPTLDRLYLVRGKKLEVYTSLPLTASTAPYLTFTVASFAGGSATFIEFNSVCLINPDGPSPTSGDGRAYHHHHKSSATRLALHAKASRDSLEDDKKEK
jgi:hypothetical protein